jgi:hypothetical protein
MRKLPLYHYTALHHADEIRASGAISRGGVPVPDQDGETLRAIVPGWQWLTRSSTWAQPWATRQVIRCDRTECRLVVEIPLLELDRLRRWDRVWPLFGFTAQAARRFAALGGGSDADAAAWYLFKGPIPYDWVVEIETRPGSMTSDAGVPSHV